MMFLLSLFALLALFAVGDAFREAESQEFPFQVSIQNANRHHLCGGAIITPKWILTASSCLKSQPYVTVAYGNADSNNPLGLINSSRIEFESSNSFLRKRSSLALVELQTPVKFSETARPASLPTSKVEMRNTTKLSGWKVSQGVNVPPNLWVSDNYIVVLKDCKKITGAPVLLDEDEFCGMDEDYQNYLYNPGSIVSKSATVLGILTEVPLISSEPFIYFKVSQKEQWIREVLQADAEHVNWVDSVKDSAPHYANVKVSYLAPQELRHELYLSLRPEDNAGLASNVVTRILQM